MDHHAFLDNSDIPLFKKISSAELRTPVDGASCTAALDNQSRCFPSHISSFNERFNNDRCYNDTAWNCLSDQRC